MNGNLSEESDSTYVEPELEEELYETFIETVLSFEYQPRFDPDDEDEWANLADAINHVVADYFEPR